VREGEKWDMGQGTCLLVHNNEKWVSRDDEALLDHHALHHPSPPVLEGLLSAIHPDLLKNLVDESRTCLRRWGIRTEQKRILMMASKN